MSVACRRRDAATSPKARFILASLLVLGLTRRVFAATTDDGKPDDSDVDGEPPPSFVVQVDDVVSDVVGDGDVGDGGGDDGGGIPIVRQDDDSSDPWFAESYQSYIQALAYPARLVVRPDPSTVADDARISFFCRADGNPLPNVVWRVNGKSVTDSRFTMKSLPSGLSTLRIEGTRLDDNGTVVSCSADNGVANPVVTEALLTVISKDKLPAGFPQIDVHPSLKSVEQGKTAYVSCRVRGDPRAKVLWLRDLIPLDIRAEGRYSVSTIGNPGALMIQHAREEDQGKYECIARNALGVVHSKAAHLYVKVRRVPPYFSYKLERKYVVGVGGAINLTCVAVGYPMPRVFWKKSDQMMLDDPAMAPIGKNVLTLTNIEQTENFTCVAVSALGNIEATTTVLAKALPPPPKAVEAASVTSTSVSLVWEPPQTDEKIVKYQVKYRQKSPGSASSSSPPSTESPFSVGYAESRTAKGKTFDTLDTNIVVDGLQPFQLYEFTVQTVGEVGAGISSLPIEAQTAESQPTSPPTNVQARSLNRDAILVKWSACERPNGMIIGNRIYYTTSDPATPLEEWTTHETKADELMATIYGLETEKRYFVRVVARNSKGDSPMSQLVTVSTKQGIPGQPPMLKAKALDSRRVQLTWDKPLFSMPLTGYTIRYNSTDGENELTLTSPHEKHLITGLKPDKFYAFRVAALSARGEGEFSEPVVEKTIPSIPLSAPSVKNVTALTSTSVLVAWTAPDVAKQNGKLVKYKISYRVVRTPPVSSLRTATTSTSDEYDDDVDQYDDHNDTTSERLELLVEPHVSSYELRNLTPYTNYEVTLSAATDDGFGPDSVLTSIRTLEDVPSAPLNFNVELTSATSVKLTWDAPKSPNGQLLGFYIYHDKMVNGEPVANERGSKKRITHVRDPLKKYFEINDLDPNTEYSVRMNAFNRHGDGEYTERRQIITQGIAPEAPEIIAVSMKNEDLPLVAIITWKTPRMRPNEGPIERFNLWLKPIGYPDSYAQTKTISGTERKTEVSGLWMGSFYDVRLNAENKEGVSGNATETLVTPVGSPDGEPLDVQYVVSTGKIVVSWRPPAVEKRNGNITFYKAMLTAMDSSGDRMEKTVPPPTTSATFDVNVRRAYTFKVAAATMKGVGPFSPVLTINPDSADQQQAQQYLGGNELGHPPMMTDQLAGVDGAPKPSDEITSADVFSAIIHHAPGPLDHPVMSGISKANPEQHALVGPPTNVRVEATSNSSAVVQWDFEASQVDSFVVKYIHEPGSRQDTEKWVQQPVLGHVRHFEVPNLTTRKPYAFCVLAVKNNRQGPCSDPPTILESVEPTYMVQSLRVRWKTSNSVHLSWDYNGPRNVGFYLNHTGKKEYLNHELQLKTMTTPGFRHDLDERAREYLWTNLRPHMQYTFHVGVRSLPPGVRQYWPKEVTTTTDATGPPFVETPRLIDSTSLLAGQQLVHLSPATEEYGEISHYWIIVVPFNYSNEDVVNMDTTDLERATAEKRTALAKQLSVSPAKKIKKKAAGQAADGVPAKRRRRATPAGAYVTARLSSTRVQHDFNTNSHFVVGDSQLYDGFTNYPLEPESKYRLMMRAFAKNEARSRESFEQRAPMSEKLSRLYSDSALTDAFSTRAALRGAAQKSSPLFGALVAMSVIMSIIIMLVCWWVRCKKKSTGRHPRHGSITKVALSGNIMNGMPGETSKLLSSNDYGRPVMNPYDQMNGNGGHMESSLDLYPLPTSHSRTNGYAPVPVPLPSLPVSGGAMGSNSLGHPPIPISELAQHIERLRGNNNAGFQQEFESIETGQHFTWEHSSAEVNKHKNRYANVAAYDHSRVVMSNVDGIAGQDYINANYIDGYDKTKCYIATQGPLPETFGDFWRMVWEEGSSTIVMLTNLEERSRVKCDQYWPSRGSSTYGDVQVTLLETNTLAHYTMRTLRLQFAGEPEVREIRHLQYTAWPDHGVPDHPTPFLVFLKRVKTLNPQDAGPIVSHCSAGIGRTGAFIVIDYMLERLRYENTVDIYGCVTRLRSQRSYMVQTEEQYTFIHDAVLDAVNSGSTEVPASRLHQHVQALMQPTLDGVSGIEMEFRHLATLKWANSRCQIANLPVNRHKNRVLSSVSFDSNRVILRVIPGIEGSDYINASWIDGYRERAAYMAMQAPLNETINDFWRTIWEQECAMIVMLVNTWERGQDMCCEYWPLETGVQVGNLVVEPIAEYNMEHYILREFRLSDVQTGLSRTVRHFHFIDWPELGRPESAEHFIDFIQQVHRAKSQFGVDGPIAVHCNSGAGRTGVFIALAVIIDRMRAEHVVDVFTTVKQLRTERQNMVNDQEQYNFLYQAAFEYLASYDHFSP